MFLEFKILKLKSRKQGLEIINLNLHKQTITKGLFSHI